MMNYYNQIFLVHYGVILKPCGLVSRHLLTENAKFGQLWPQVDGMTEKEKVRIWILYNRFQEFQ